MSGDPPAGLLRQFAAVVGESHVLTGDAAAGYTVDWTGGFTGHAPAVLRPGGTAEVAALLGLCADAGVAVVPQGGNTGLVGGGVPLHGEVVLSLARLDRLGPVDLDAGQVSAGAGVSLQQVAGADPGLDLGVFIASRHSATVGGAVATNAGGLRVLRHGPMRAQLRGIEAVLSDGTVLSHMSGLVKDNTGYDYPSLLAGSEGTLAVITAARLQLVPRMTDPVTVIVGVDGPGEVHALARRAVREVGGLQSAEFFTQAGLGLLAEHAGLALPLRPPTPAYLLLEAAGPAAAGGTGRAGRRPAGRGRHRRGRAGPAVGLPGAPPRGGRVHGGAAEAGCFGARGAVGAAGLRGGGGRRGGGSGGTGDHLRPRGGRQPARERGAREGRSGRGGRGWPSRGRGLLVRGVRRLVSAEHGIPRSRPLAPTGALGLRRALFARLGPP